MIRTVMGAAISVILLPLIFGIMRFQPEMVLATIATTASGTLLFGVPVAVLLIKHKVVSWGKLALFGALGGVLVSLAFTIISQSSWFLLVASWGFMALGAIHGLLFWFIAIWRNPFPLGSGENANDIDPDLPA
jgi:hypothetical protein